MQPRSRALSAALALVLLGALSCSQEPEEPWIPPGRKPASKPASKPEDPGPPPLAPEAEALRSAWLRSPLTGQDSKGAKVKGVSISSGFKWTYQIFFESQYEMLCGLEFGPDGRPAALVRVTWSGGSQSEQACGGREAFTSGEDKIPLSCTEEKGKEVCRGAYTLNWPSGVSDPAELQFTRPLGVPLIGERPASGARPGGDAACQELDCKGKRDGFAVCRGQAAEAILCKCQGGAAGNEGRCAAKTTCTDANDGYAECR